MALMLGRRVGEIVYAEFASGKVVELQLLSHHNTGDDKTALVRATFENLDQDEHHLSLNKRNEAYVCEGVSIFLGAASKKGVRLGFKGAPDVTFLRKEVKERMNG